jgi:hypothetical protein
VSCSLRVGVDFFGGVLNRCWDALQYAPDLRGRTTAPGFTELPQFFCRRPSYRAIEGQGQAVFGKVLGRGREFCLGEFERFCGAWRPERPWRSG